MLSRIKPWTYSWSFCIIVCVAFLMGCVLVNAAPDNSKGVPVLSEDGRSIMSQGREYRPIDEAGVYYYDAASVSGLPMPVPRGELSEILERHGFHGMVRVELVDYVDCSQTTHEFIDDGTSRVMELSDGDKYRLTAPGGEMTWFAYFMKTRPNPGRPHLMVVQTINDIERYTTVTMTQPQDEPWADPYKGEETFPAECQEPHPYHPDVGGCVYTGREYPLDGKPLNYMFLYYPKANKVKVTISHMTRELQFREDNGAAIARMWFFDILDPMEDFATQPAVPVEGRERQFGLYIPHPWFIYSHHGVPSRTLEQRMKNLRSFTEYLQFCGINQIQFHIINGSDVAGRAWYDSELYDPLQGNLIEEFFPMALDAGIELVPIVTPIMTPYRGNLSAIPDADNPDEHGFSKLSLQLNRKGEYTNAMGNFVPDPLRPEVQEWLFKCFREVLDRAAHFPNMSAMAFRVNGKIGICYVGSEADMCGQDTGYSERNISEFEKDTGIQVPRMEPTSYEWLKENAWEEWIDWRCRRIHDFWVRTRDLVQSYRPDLKLLIACDLPSEYPGYNIEWVDGVPPRELMRHHGYDPELFKDEEGIIIQRGMIIAGDRYWTRWGPPQNTNFWAHKAFNYAEGVVECYETPSGHAVEFYHNYWEEFVHPDPQYGPVMRTATAAPWGQFYYEPATYSIRKANVHTMMYMGWERATIGHEHDIRRFARAYRALPYTDPVDFDGTLTEVERIPGAVYDKPEHPDVWVKWFGDCLAVLNDTGDQVRVSLTIPRPLPTGSCLFDLAANRILVAATDRDLSEIEIDLHLVEHDLHTLAILPLNEAKALEAVVSAPAVDGPGVLRMHGPEVPYGGQESVFRVMLDNIGRNPITGAEIDIKLPEDWDMVMGAEGIKPNVRFRITDTIAPGESAGVDFRVDIPAGDVGEVSWVTASASYQSDGQEFADQTSVIVSPHAPIALSVTPERTSEKVAGDRADVQVELRNMLSSPVDVMLDYDVPEGWGTLGRRNRVRLAAGDSTSFRLILRIPEGIESGRHTFGVTAETDGYTTSRVESVFELPLVAGRAVSPIMVDADLSEWGSVAPDALVVDSSQFRAGDSDEAPSADLSPTMRLSWDERNLYLACTILGGEFRHGGSGADMWSGDSIQFGIDAARGLTAAGNYELGVTLSPDGVETWRWTAPGEQSSGPIPNGSFIARSDGTTQTYELAIPWSELAPFEPGSGRAIGFSLIINYDRGQSRDYVRWYDGIAEAKDPSQYATIVLR